MLTARLVHGASQAHQEIEAFIERLMLSATGHNWKAVSHARPRSFEPAEDWLCVSTARDTQLGIAVEDALMRRGLIYLLNRDPALQVSETWNTAPEKMLQVRLYPLSLDGSAGIPGQIWAAANAHFEYRETCAVSKYLQAFSGINRLGYGPHELLGE